MPEPTPRSRAACFPPGAFLRDELAARGWSVDEAARRMARPAWSPQRVGAVLDGTEPMTAGVALALGRLLGTSPDLWLALGRAWQLWQRERRATSPSAVPAAVCGGGDLPTALTNPPFGGEHDA